MPNSPIAAGQHAALLTIDTACHWLRGEAGAGDCFAGGGTLDNLLHMNRLSTITTASYPSVSSAIEA